MTKEKCLTTLAYLKDFYESVSCGRTAITTAGNEGKIVLRFSEICDAIDTATHLLQGVQDSENMVITNYDWLRSYFNGNLKVSNIKLVQNEYGILDIRYDMGDGCFLTLDRMRKYNVEDDYILQWLDMIHEKKPLLDDKEKEYLEAVIKPLKLDGVSVIKGRYSGKYERIYIRYDHCGETKHIDLPPFEAGKMYEGLKQSKAYTMKELDL